MNFSSREDDHAILIYKLEPTTGMLRTRAYIGQHMPLYCSAMGKIYMAFGHPDYVEHYWNTHQDIIQPLTRNTITGLPAMHDELAQIRERNMAMDREENELGCPVWRCRFSIFTSACPTPFLFLCRRRASSR